MDHQFILFDNKIVKMINTLFLLVLCLVTNTSHRVDGIQTTPKEELELEKQLKLINKDPITSIHVFFTYTFY